MNLPNYLEPAPPFDEEKHGFDFPFRAHSPSWADKHQNFTAPCRCGQDIRVPQPEVARAITSFAPFRKYMDIHIETIRTAERLRSKWGAQDMPIPLDSYLTTV